jgi:hypothetical protein
MFEKTWSVPDFPLPAYNKTARGCRAVVPLKDPYFAERAFSKGVMTSPVLYASG